MIQLLDIHEPGQTPQPHQDDKPIAIGIDLGTTHSLAAFAEKGTPAILKDAQEEQMVPSIVSYTEGGTIAIGHDAARTTDATIFRSIKRLMGKGKHDLKEIAGTLPFEIQNPEDATSEVIHLPLAGGKTVTPVEVSSEILKQLRKNAEERLNGSVTKAVITVPAYFDDAARTATRDAARLAGLEVLRLVNEPTAAALAYGLDTGAEGLYVVYDLGGGTFDVSLLRLQKGVFQVLATGGDTALGGDDFDAELAEHLMEQYDYEALPENIPVEELQAVLLAAKSAKEALTTEKQTTVKTNVAGMTHSCVITQETYQSLIEEHVQLTLTILAKVLEDADVSKEEIQDIVLVGGATRTPLVKQEVQTFFGKPALDSVDPDCTVALGAAIQAHTLTHGTGNLLLDVTPLSLGLEMMGGMVEKVIHRNTPIPVSVAQEFTTYQDGQTGLQLHILQGDREMVDDCRSLARFELTNIPPMKAGVARIQVVFSLDADGLLTVRATEETTGETQFIEVKPTYGLEREKIEQMLRDSMVHAREDMESRLLMEAKTEANRSIVAINSAMSNDGILLTDAEKNAITEQLQSLEKTLECDNRDDVLYHTEQLEKIASVLAEKQIQHHVASQLEGMHLDALQAIASHSKKGS